MKKSFKKFLVSRFFVACSLGLFITGCDDQTEVSPVPPSLSLITTAVPDTLLAEGGSFELRVEWEYNQWNIRVDSVLTGSNFITQISPSVAGAAHIGNTTTTVRVTYGRNESFRIFNVVRLILRSVTDTTMFDTLTVVQPPQGGVPPGDPLQGRRPTNLQEYFMTYQGLKHYFADLGYFNMGVAVEPEAFTDPVRRRIIDRHFNSLVAENAMKWDAIQPRQGVWNWTRADQIVNFATQNNMRLRGHTLVWHSQLPSWVTVDSRGNQVSKDTLLARIRHHVTTVVSRYRGRVHYWDVVNEAIVWAGTFRESPLWQIAGMDFILEAFRAARAADPNAKLFYNDYAETHPPKRDLIITLLRRLQQENLVDGMGMQGHWALHNPTSDLVRTAIRMYSDLGLDVQITELDVTVYARDTDPAVPYSEVSIPLRNAYVRYFQIFRENKDRISNVTLWGVTDAHSWLNNWPVRGRDNHPLLFDRAGQPKQAYFGIINY